MPTRMLAQNWYIFSWTTKNICMYAYSILEFSKNTHADIFRRIIKLRNLTNKQGAACGPQSNHVPFGIRFLDIKLHQGLK